MTAGAMRGGRPSATRRGAVLALLLVVACGRGVDLRAIDEAGERLRELMGVAMEALAGSDSEALRACRADLVRLRLEARGRTLPAPAAALRDTLVAAMDQLADGFDATAAGVDARLAGEREEDPVRGREHALAAARHLEFGQVRLEGALATLHRFQEQRAALEGK